VSAAPTRRLWPLTPAMYQSRTPRPGTRGAGPGGGPGGEREVVRGELDLATGEMTRWAEPRGFWLWGAWSPDGKRAVVSKSMGTPTESYVLERDGRLTRLLPSALRVHPVEWLSEGMLVATDVDRDFVGLGLIDPEQPESVSRWLLSEEHDVEGTAV